MELITNKEKGVFQPAHRVNSQVPERLSLIVDKAMAKDPKHRYQHMKEFVKDLEALGLAASRSRSSTIPTSRSCVAAVEPRR